jgi:hypothetical protein
VKRCLIKNEYYHNELSQGLGNNHHTVANPSHIGKHLYFNNSSSEETVELSNASSPDDDLLYEEGAFVTCRNSSDTFYLCQVLQNVYIYTKNIRIRWCSVIGEKGDDTKISIHTKFKLDYTDKLNPNTILMDIPDLVKNPDGTFSLKKQHIVDTKRLLEKSIMGESLSSDDIMDLSTEHERPTQKSSAPSHIHFDSSSGSSDTSASSVAPKNSKRKKTVRPKQSRKQPAKRQRRAKASSEVSDEEAKPVKPKKKRMNK